MCGDKKMLGYFSVDCIVDSMRGILATKIGIS